MEDAHDAVSATAGPAPAATGEELLDLESVGQDKSLSENAMLGSANAICS